MYACLPAERLLACMSACRIVASMSVCPAVASMHVWLPDSYYHARLPDSCRYACLPDSCWLACLPDRTTSLNNCLLCCYMGLAPYTKWPDVKRRPLLLYCFSPILDSHKTAYASEAARSVCSLIQLDTLYVTRIVSLLASIPRCAGVGILIHLVATGL